MDRLPIYRLKNTPLLNMPLQNSPRWVSRLVAALCLLAAAILLPAKISAAEVPVRHAEGSTHAFLLLRTLEGKVLAIGEFVQTIHLGRLTSRVTFQFTDGSLDDETTVYSQRGSFRLISDHHIQKGPIFPHPVDVSVNALTGEVTAKSAGKDGEEKVVSEHTDLPSDLSNGLLFILLKNIAPDAANTSVSYLSEDAKPRVVKVLITRAGTEPVSIGPSRRRATRYDIKIDIGGLAGAVAPLVGKEPKGMQAWTLGNGVPALIRFEGQLYGGGPIWRIDPVLPSWPNRR